MVLKLKCCFTVMIGLYDITMLTMLRIRKAFSAAIDRTSCMTLHSVLDVETSLQLLVMME